MPDSAVSSASGAWGQAQTQWADTLAKWRDTKAQEFQNTFWSEYARAVPQFLSALDDLSRAIRESQRRIQE